MAPQNQKGGGQQQRPYVPQARDGGDPISRAQLAPLIQRDAPDLRGTTILLHGASNTGKSTGIIGDPRVGVEGMNGALVISCEGGDDPFTGVLIQKVHGVAQFIKCTMGVG
jgi:hypothetical protein